MENRPLVTVAHRAGNQLADLHAALDAGVDMIEADVHLYRRVLEVRHRKALGPHLYLEKWYELNRRRSIVLPDPAELLAHVHAVTDGLPRLMLDLKGPRLGVAPEVAALLNRSAPDMPVSVCTKQWRMLDAFNGSPNVRQVMSAANWLQLTRLRARLRGRRVARRSGEQPASDGRAAGLSIYRNLLTPDIVAELHQATDLVMVWPVDTEEALAHARRLGVSGVISKNLPMLRRLVAESASPKVVEAGIIGA
jgi:glycerophosphoryl diester phosphodiesterase